MNRTVNRNIAGFSLLELVIAMTITLMLMAMAGAIFSHSIGTRERETRRTQAIIAAQNALTLISREVANSGYGLTDNGLIIADSNNKRLHFRSNIENGNTTTNDVGEDLTYYLDPATNAAIRYDRFDNPQTSTVVNRVDNLSFEYWDYTGGSMTRNDTPSANTARIRVSIAIKLDPVQGQPDDQAISYTSDVTLRNSRYISNQY